MKAAGVVASLLLVLAAAAGEDPDVGRDGPELIRARGYPVENHYVTTEDSFVLRMFRIPAAAAGAPVVFLQHGLLDSADTWLMGRAVGDAAPWRYSSLAYAFADSGFEVWLGNSRGNKYSRNSTRYSPNWPFDERFWAFDWESMARYDMPAQVDYALRVSGAGRLTYVGHSQGTTQAFANFATPEWSVHERVSLFVALAPVAYVHHTTSLLLRALVDLDVPALVSLLGVREFLPTSELLRLLLPGVCAATPPLCESVIYLFAGLDLGDLDKARLPVYVAHFPSGTSATNMVKWGQGVKHDTFGRWDYGPLLNPSHYDGRSSPPPYNLTAAAATTPPVALFSGGRDALADPADVAHLAEVLPPGVLVAQNRTAAYGHLDFVWGEHAYKTVYPEVVRLAQLHS